LPPLALVLEMALILEMATADSEPKNVAKFLNQESRLGGRRSGDEGAVIAVALWFAAAAASDCVCALQRLVLALGWSRDCKQTLVLSLWL
jgi:hypothetical protein